MTSTGVQAAAFDAWTNSALPTSNKSTQTTLKLSSSGQRGWLYFALPPALPGDTIISAKLRLYQKGAATGGTRTLSIRLADGQWTASAITDANKPGVTGATATLALGNSAVDGREWEFDVEPLISQVAAGTPWFGFRVTSDIATALKIYASESAVFQPTLEIEYSPDVDAPMNLRPDHENSVSIARPTLQWASLLPATIGSYQVQISTSPTFSTFVGGQDSGQVFSILPEHTINFDLVPATDYFWRAKVWSQAGVASEWSPTAEFRRTAKPTVTIDNPAVAPNNFVNEASPPFGWTVTGGTQTKFQLQLWDVTATPILIYDSEQVNGAANAHTPPLSGNILFETSKTYRVTLRVWDDVARQVTPGDPDYVEVSRDFTFVFDPSVDPVDTISAVTDMTPYVPITVTRPTAPDFFQVFAGDTPITELIEPSDVFVAGTTYKINVLTFPARTPLPNVYVACIVNGVTSDLNPSVAIETKPEGIWLCRADGTFPVCIVSDNDIGDWTTGETSAVHQPVGSRYAVVLYQSRGARNSVIRGYLQGEQFGLEDISIDDWKERWDALMKPLGQKLLLSLTDSTIPVYVRNALASPANEDREVPVSFEAYERPAD